MWKQKIGISVYNHYRIPTCDVIRLLCETGFDAVSPEWEPDIDLNAIVETARQCGMTVQSLHAPYGKMQEIWSRDSSVSEPAKAEIFSALDACATFSIPVLVMHAWIGFDYQFNPESLYYQNFDEIISYAKERNIQIAFENTEGEEFLFALMERYAEEPAVGFCWDSGHEMCYNHSQALLAKLGDRLIMTHINDNLGISRFDGKTFWTDDLHLLPYDGIGDWDDNIARLKKARHMDILNFELNINSKPNRHENDIYGEMGYELYFTEVLKRACRIASRYAKYTVEA